MYKNFIKRLIDLTVSIVLLFLVSPIFLMVSLLLLLAHKGNPFFMQLRPGYRERPFFILKFKTMGDIRDHNGVLLPDKERITGIGRYLRKLSIDELPQMLNVIKGDMSLVGPRPLLFKYITLYSERQRSRHNVKPGITGLAQVSGRNSIAWAKKFELDVYYTEHVSLGLDLKILLLTAIKVIKREGVNQSSERPMQPFDGNN